MQPLARILLPVDFSERSLGAARCARRLAERFHAELILLHVLTPPHYEFGALEIGGSMLTELYVCRSVQAEKELAAFLPDAPGAAPARRVVLEGDPARKIVEYAHAEQASLIVMPTHGYGQFRRFILGSITAKVLHDANCPVWTGVHLEEMPKTDCMGVRRVLCALDLGPQSSKTLEWAAMLQKEFGSQIDVVHVAICAPGTPDGDPGIRAGMEQRIREELALLLERTGTCAEISVLPGDPPHVICREAERIKADLLVIGRGSAAGVFGRLRTNAYAIIRQSPCPVVSV
ncbi:MAG: universal stress protein [Bryobacteraceae bacterium]